MKDILLALWAAIERPVTCTAENLDASCLLKLICDCDIARGVGGWGGNPRGTALYAYLHSRLDAGMSVLFNHQNRDKIGVTGR